MNTMMICKLMALSVVLMAPVHAEVKQAAALAPSDIGAFKWIVGATAGTGEVVILRYSRIWTAGDKKSVDTHDKVSYSPGKRVEGSFVAIDPNYFTPSHSSEPNWHIAAFGGSGWVQGKCSSSSIGNNFGSITFTNKSGDIYEYQFTAIVMSHEEALTIYDDLPDLSATGWRWGGSPNKGVKIDEVKVGSHLLSEGDE